MKFIFALILCFGSAGAYGKNAPMAGFIEIRPDHKIYVEHYPAQNGRPTLFMANGLTFSTEDYTYLVRSLRELDPDLGIVLWDMDGMGQTLLRTATDKSRIPFEGQIPIEEQVRDLHELKAALGISGKASLAGLSYGGALTLKYALTHPGEFDNYVALAPMLERLPEQDMWIRHMTRMHMMWASSPTPFTVYYAEVLQRYALDYLITWYRALNPDKSKSREELRKEYEHMITTREWWQDTLFSASGLPDPENYEEVYDYYLRILIYSTYWMAEPSVLENRYKLEGVFRMVQGVKNWNALEAAKRLPNGKIHLMAALQDEHVKIDRADAFWSKIPKDARSSYLRLNSSRHKISSEWPKVTAVWLLNIMNENPELNRGFTFAGDPIDKVAVHGSTKIPLNKVGSCEALLRETPQSSEH